MDYWDECVRCALEEAGVIATEEQIVLVAEAVKGGHENYGLAMGHECIPNPLQREVEGLKADVQTAVKETELAVEDFRKNVARRWNVSTCQVILEGNGNATVYP